MAPTLDLDDPPIYPSLKVAGFERAHNVCLPVWTALRWVAWRTCNRMQWEQRLCPGEAKICKDSIWVVQQALFRNNMSDYA